MIKKNLEGCNEAHDNNKTHLSRLLPQVQNTRSECCPVQEERFFGEKADAAQDSKEELEPIDVKSEDAEERKKTKVW